MLIQKVIISFLKILKWLKLHLLHWDIWQWDKTWKHDWASTRGKSPRFWMETRRQMISLKNGKIIESRKNIQQKFQWRSKNCLDIENYKTGTIKIKCLELIAQNSTVSLGIRILMWKTHQSKEKQKILETNILKK